MRLLFVVALATCFASSLARQEYRGLLPNGNNVPCPPGDPHCEEGHVCVGIGHESCGGGVLTPGLNPFGQDLLKEDVRWSKELCEKDSDGDGFSNGHELGDPCCIWKQGAEIPEWMLNWPISHPGSKDSTQLPDQDIEALCKDKKPLKEADMYAEGEDRIAWDFAIKEYAIPAEDTTYVDVRFNFPEEGIFYLVGGEALVDNTEMVHHYVVSSCTDLIDDNLTGEAAPLSEGREENCTTTIWAWAPGGSSRQPRNVAIPVGAGVGTRGINIQMHYDNPKLIEGRTDASVLRLHLTSKPREHEGGVLYMGGITSIGVIPPKKTMYSSTIIQVKVDPEIAPEGITVYGFTPHMHALGKKLWVEKLARTPEHKQELLQRFEHLEKVEDIGRDDHWHIDLQGQKDVPFLTLRDGDYVATTCVFNSDKMETSTVGGLSSQEEMCIGFLSVFPANAVDTTLLYNGPQFFNELTEETYTHVNSFMDILKLPESNGRVPLWRRAYLSGELECKDEKPETEDRLSKASGVFMHDDTIEKGLKACGATFQKALHSPIDPLVAPTCSTKCARFVYHMLGCSLLWQAESPTGIIMELYPSYPEARANSWCSEAFRKVYFQDRVHVPSAGKSLGRK